MSELTINSPIFAKIVEEMRKNVDPVDVKHGRKFRGFGYVVSTYDKSNGGYSGSGVRPLKYYDVNRVWIPSSDTYDSFNSFDPKEVVDVPNEQFSADMFKYVSNIFEAAKKRCGEDVKWRMNYLKKVLGLSYSLVNEIVSSGF